VQVRAARARLVRPERGRQQLLALRIVGGRARGGHLRRRERQGVVADEQDVERDRDE
jgi:hypothetical protein